MIKKINVGVIGTNFITDWVINGARQDSRFNLVAVYSRTQETANAFADKHQIPNTFTSLQEMATSPLIDAVYVASPNFLHAEQSILMMNNGKHVLCEKPFASNVKEVKAMITTAQANNVVLMEAMKTTLTPNFIALRDNLSTIGTVRRYFSSYCQYSSRYDKYREGIILNAFNPELSNGAMMDIGVYTIYPLVVLFGRPQEIKATGIKLSSGVDGQGSVCLSYPEMEATVIYSKIANSSLPTEIQGEEGNITLNRINIIESVKLTHRKGGEEELTQPTTSDEYYHEVHEFLNLIETSSTESTINSHQNSLIVMEIIEEVRRQLDVVYPAD